MKLDNINEKLAYYISHNWFLNKANDPTKFLNISIGKIIQLYTFELLFNKANSTSSNISIVNVIKKLRLDWKVRFFYNYFFLKSDYDKNKKYDLLLIYDVNNNPMIENLNKVAESALSKGLSVIALTIDLNTKNKILKDLDFIFLSDFYDIEVRKKAKNNYKSIIKNFSLVKSKISSNLKNEYNLSLIIDKIYSFFKSQLKQTIKEILCTDLLLKKINPNFIISSTDAHKISRMFCMLSKHHKIKSLVIQHGAPIWKYGYVPIFADYISVWGKESKKWFIENGVDHDKIIVTGCPRYQNNSFLLKIKDFNLKKKPNLFLLTNPIEMKTNIKILNYFLNIDSKFFNSVVLKPHPSEKNINFYRKIINSHSNNFISIDTLNNIDSLIEVGDIVIVLNSTAGIDSLLNGCVLINLEIKDFPNSVPYSKFSVSISTNLQNLSKSVVEALNVRNNLKSYFKKVKLFLHDYVNLENNTSDYSKNILNFILDNKEKK